MRIVAATLAVAILMFTVSRSPVRAEETAPPLFIEGYTDQLSYTSGAEIQFHVSTSAPKYSIEIARLGAERKIVFTRDDLPGAVYPIPEDASSQGCGWPASFRHRVPATWKSGYYTVTLRVSDTGGRFTYRDNRTADAELFFVVRSSNPGRRTPILIELATNTYNAFNNWGGSSLYGFNSKNKLQGHRVSFNRPLRGFFANWELPFVVWAERNGYELDYAVNSDLEFHPELLEKYRLILSVGRDEYWSAGMRDHVEAFIKQGGNVAFLGGKEVCWQVRMEQQGRGLTCWKQSFNQDPAFRAGDHSLLSTLWSHYLVNRPENQLTGVGFLFGGHHKSRGQFMDGSGAYTVHRPEHWVFAGTGLKQGAAFGGKHAIVGPDCAGCEIRIENGLPVPTFRDGTPVTFVILSTAPARWHPHECEWYEQWDKGRTGAAVMGVYTRGGTVFTAGTSNWSHGLRGGDPIVERITRNVLDRLTRPPSE